MACIHACLGVIEAVGIPTAASVEKLEACTLSSIEVPLGNRSLTVARLWRQTADGRLLFQQHLQTLFVHCQQNYFLHKSRDHLPSLKPKVTSKIKASTEKNADIRKNDTFFEFLRKHRCHFVLDLDEFIRLSSTIKITWILFETPLLEFNTEVKRNFAANCDLSVEIENSKPLSEM